MACGRPGGHLLLFAHSSPQKFQEHSLGARGPDVEPQAQMVFADQFNDLGGDKKSFIASFG